MRSAHTLLLCVALFVAGCLSQSGLGEPPPKPAPGVLKTRSKTDPKTGKVIREWSTLVFGDRPAVKHGVEKTYYPSGEPQWTREYDEGKPRGAWRSFYEDGKLRSESFYGDAARDTQMSFWHPNGQLSMRGPARNGVRTGTWTFWYANGQKAEEGPYVASKREGAWQAWTKDGHRVFERFYKKNVRVSERLITELAPSTESFPEPAAEPDPDLDEEPRQK